MYKLLLIKKLIQKIKKTQKEPAAQKPVHPPSATLAPTTEPSAKPVSCGAHDEANGKADGVSPVAAPSEFSFITLFKLKMIFFMIYFGLGAANPFLPVIYSSKGLSASGIGILATTSPVLLLLLLPHLSYVADRFDIGMHISAFTMCSACVIVYAILHINSLPMVCVAAVLYYLVQVPITPSTDRHVMGVLGPGNSALWGAQRVWGSLGWGVGAPLGSAIVDRYGWNASIYQYAAGMAAVLYCMVTTKPKKMVTEQNYSAVIRMIVHCPRTLLFCTTIIAVGTGTSVCSTYNFVFLKSLGGSQLLLGLTCTCKICAEMPVFKSTSWLLGTSTDAQRLTASAVLFAILGLAYSFTWNPWFGLLLEPLNGLTYSLMWITGVNFVSHRFTPDLLNSAFGCLHSCAWGSVLSSAICSEATSTSTWAREPCTGSWHAPSLRWGSHFTLHKSTTRRLLTNLAVRALCAKEVLRQQC